MYARRTIYCLMSFVFDYLCDVEITHILYQVFTNTGSQVAVATKFCALAPNTYGSSIWDLLHVDLLASRILRNLLHFSKICAALFFIPTCFGCTILRIGMPRRFSHTKMPNEIQNVHCTYRQSTASLCHISPAPTRPSRDITPKRARCTQISRYAYHDAAMDPRTHSE